MTPEQQDYEAESTGSALTGTLTGALTGALTGPLTRALAALDDLDALPVAEHVARFEAVHEEATRTLSTIDGA